MGTSQRSRVEQDVLRAARTYAETFDALVRERGWDALSRLYYRQGDLLYQATRLRDIEEQEGAAEERYHIESLGVQKSQEPRGKVVDPNIKIKVGDVVTWRTGGPPTKDSSVHVISGRLGSRVLGIVAGEATVMVRACLARVPLDCLELAE